MATIELTKENLQSTIDDHPIVLIDFWADWCGPCKMFAPLFEKASEQHPDIAFAKCDTKLQPEVAAAFDVQSIPTLAVFRDKVMLFLQPGALPPAALEELIAKVRELDMAQVRQSLQKQGPPPAPAAGAQAARTDRRPGTPGAARPGAPRPGMAAPGPAPAAPGEAKLVATVETGDGLKGLSDDFVLRRQGVTSEFLQAAGQSDGLARKVLELYGRIRARVREQGAEGRDESRREREAFAFDPGRDLEGLDADTRSEIKAVLRAIEELIKA